MVKSTHQTKMSEKQISNITPCSTNEESQENSSTMNKCVPLTPEMLFSMHGLDISLPVQCDFCPKTFQDMEQFDAHMITHKECRVFSCQLCNNVYKSWGNLVAHRKACHHGEVINCAACGERKYHPDLGPVNFPIGNNPNGCEECGEGFASVMQLYRHYRIHGTHQFMPAKGKLTKVLDDQYSSGDETSRSCNDSDTIHLDVKKQENDDFSSSRNTLYKCNMCERAFSNRKQLLHHKITHSASKLYRCDCGQEFSELQHISAHVHEDHLDASLMCTICSQTAGEHFLAHFYTSHITKGNKRSNSQSKEVCSICHKVFSQTKAYVSHMKLHEREKGSEIVVHHTQILDHLKSPDKHKKLERLTEQEKKISEVVARRSFICEYCGREFGKKLSLQLHVRRHTGERPYSCQFCGKSFYTNQQLSIHVRRHTGERPYSCGVCQKAFTGPSALYMHKKLHVKTKPFLCSHCGKRFSCKSAYMGHIRLHTGERPYQCSVCSKEFTSRGKMNFHLKKHIILACSDCGENFSSEAELTAHQNEQCCMTMITYIQEGPSGEKDTRIILMNPEDLQQSNVYIDNPEVVNLVVE